MTSPLRIGLTAAVAAAVLVVASPAAAADSSYTPFETDFPRSAQPSASLDQALANDRAHFGPGSVAAPAEPTASPQVEPTASGFDWGTAGAVALGVALVVLVALGLTRRSKRVAIGFVFVAGITSLALTGIVAAGGDKKDPNVASPRDLRVAGWLCVDVPDNWVHCVPPGVDLENDPPESMLNLNYYTHDIKSDDAEFLGEETLIRADVWKALPRQWPCGKKEYGFVPAEALPPYGYMYCHHFNEPKPLPEEGVRK
jgi:hypothetical protein